MAGAAGPRVGAGGRATQARLESAGAKRRSARPCRAPASRQAFWADAQCRERATQKAPRGPADPRTARQAARQSMWAHGAVRPRRDGHCRLAPQPCGNPGRQAPPRRPRQWSRRGSAPGALPCPWRSFLSPRICLRQARRSPPRAFMPHACRPACLTRAAACRRMSRCCGAGDRHAPERGASCANFPSCMYGSYMTQAA